MSRDDYVSSAQSPAEFPMAGLVGQHIRDRVGDEIVASRIGVPVVGLHVNPSKRLDWQVDRLSIHRRGHPQLADAWEVEAFPPAGGSAVRVHVPDTGAGWQRRAIAPDAIARV